MPSCVHHSEVMWASGLRTKLTTNTYESSYCTWKNSKWEFFQVTLQIAWNKHISTLENKNHWVWILSSRPIWTAIWITNVIKTVASTSDRSSCERPANWKRLPSAGRQYMRLSSISNNIIRNLSTCLRIVWGIENVTRHNFPKICLTIVCY